MYFTVYLDVSGQWRWNLKSANHEIIASGESYTTKQNCMKAVSLVQSTSVTTPVYER